MISEIRESEVESKAVVYGKKRGWWTRKIIGADGEPDRVFIRNGRTIWIEFKRPKNAKHAANQKECMEQMLEAGAEVFLCDDLVDAYDILR